MKSLLFFPVFFDDAYTTWYDICGDTFDISRQTRMISDIDEKTIVFPLGCEWKNMRMGFSEKPSFMEIFLLEKMMHIDFFIYGRNTQI